MVEQNKPTPNKPTPVETKPEAKSQAAATTDFEIFAREYEEDNKAMRWALGAAAVFHLILLAVQLPDLMSQAAAAPDPAKVYVVQQVRFKKPPPEQKQELPKPKAKKVPIPDPTPDEPEPIREIEQEEPTFDVPDTDVLWDIPTGPPPSEPDGPIIVAGDVVAPEKVDAPQPQYTEIARKARVQGVVIVQAIIDKEGQVTNVKVLKGLPMGLEDAAVDAVKRWKFRPATLNGKPVAVYYNLTVNFRIQ